MRISKRFWTMALVLWASLAEPAMGGLSPKKTAELRVHVLNVGDALCSVVECPGSDKEALLFDCGRYGADELIMSKEQIKAYLASVLGDKTVSVVLSHPATDHYSEVLSIPGTAKVKTVYLGGSWDSYPHKLKTWLADIEKGKKGSVKIGFKAGQFGPIQDLACGVAATEMLTVNAGMWIGKDSENANSLVAAVSHGEFRAIFPGDANSQTLASILWNQKGKPIRSSLLIAPHHGSRENGENGFLWDTVFTPQAVVYSAGSSTTNPRCMDVRWQENNKLKVDTQRSTAFAYQGTASTEEAHLVWCNTGQIDPYEQWWKLNYKQKQYVTYLSGIVVMTVDKSDKGAIVCLDNAGEKSKC